MGLNAQTSVPAFTAGQVLTAAQVTQINTGVPVFADTTARDGAFGGAGEKTLAQGQYAYIEATSTLQVYNGTAWVSAGSGLVYITGTSFSAAATVSLPNSTFSSTYANYRVIYDLTAGSTDLSVTMRLRASGSDITGANYNTGLIGPNNAGTNGNLNDLNGTSAKVGLGISSTGVNQAYLIVDIIGPQLADKTVWSVAGLSQTSSVGSVSWYSGGGLYNATDQADALTLIASTGNITGSYRVYGYANS